MSHLGQGSGANLLQATFRPPATVLDGTYPLRLEHPSRLTNLRFSGPFAWVEEAMSVAIVTALAVLAGLALIAAVLRTMAIARRADEIAEQHWQELARLQSDSGVAFFPTAEARLELEMALTEILELEPRPAPARRRTAALVSRVS